MTKLMQRHLAGSWPLDALRLGAVMAALSLLLGFAVDLAFDPAPSRLRLDAEREFLPAVLLLAALAIAPLGETALLAALHWLLRACLGLPLTVWACVSALLFGYLHLDTYRVPAPQAAAFLLMSYQYALVRDRHGAGTAYAAVALSHALCNGMIVVPAVTLLWFAGAK